MSKIVKEHFKKDIDEYIKNRRNIGKKPFLNFKVRVGKSEKKQDKTSTTETPNKNVVNRLLVKNKKAHAIEDEDMDIPEEEVQRVLDNEPLPKSEPKSLISKIFGSFSKDDTAEDVPTYKVKALVKEKEQETQKPTQHTSHKSPELSQDAIEVLKIAGKWLNRMDPQTKELFKESPDFAKYKFYLDKLGLSKK